MARSQPARRGRPSLYREDYAEQARKLCLLGATDADMADFFEVNESTVQDWRKAHDDFADAVRRGKTEADAKVAERLYERACGYRHEAVKIFMPAGASEPVYAPYTEHYPPDTQAASLWLRNRRPDKWRDKLDHEHTGPSGAPLIPVLNVTINREEEVRRRIAEIFGGDDKPEPPKAA